MLYYYNFETIIFDLGNTILPIAPENTVVAFKKLGLEDNILNSKNPLLDAYQRGERTSKSFIDSIQNILPPNTSSSKIEAAWNAMLLDYPPQHIELLQRLKKHHQLLLLSNTNELHYNCFIDKARKQGLNFDVLFEATHYSHKLGMSKPNANIFRFVIESHQLNPARTLFIDDLAENINMAKQLGLAVYHLHNNKSILDLEMP